MTDAQPHVADPAVLLKRARHLARSPTEKSVREVAGQVAVLSVGDGLYGITVSALESVVQTPPISRLPGLPPWMRGIVQIRGRILSAVDGRRWLGVDGGVDPDQEQRYLAVLSSPQGELGLIVDRIIDFRTVYADEIVDSLSEGGAQQDRPVRAVTRDLLNLVDVEALFRAADLGQRDLRPQDRAPGRPLTDQSIEKSQQSNQERG